jgi:succinoglycan biosynthesis transport protein ExoP
LLDIRKTTVIDMQAVVGGMQGGDVASIRSELDVIASPALLERVITQLGLLGNPDFNHNLNPKKSIRDYVKTGLTYLLPRSVSEAVFPPSDESLLSPDEREQRLMAQAVRWMQDDLSVFNDQGRSYTIRLNYTSTNPKLAAQIVNAVAHQYLTSQLESKFQKTQQVNQWLQEKLSDLKTRVQTSDNAVQAYRRDKNLLTNATGTNVVNQQLSDLNTQLALAAADAAQKRGALQQFQSTVKAGISRAEATPEVLASTTIGQLKVQESVVSSRLANEEATLGSKHPTILKSKQELAAIQGSISVEIQKIIGNMATQAQSADYRVQQLHADLAKLSVTAQQNNQAEIQLQQLEREAQANRFLYENMLNRFKETSESQDIQQPDATVIAQAVVPLNPSFPNKPLYTFMAFLGSACLGLSFALLAERFDHGFRTGAQIENETGVASLGMIPNLSGKKVVDELIKRPTSVFSESVRSIRVNAFNVDRPPRVVLVTSAAPDEGKSTTAFSLARAAAQSGQRVLLVDCDWRRPSLHHIMGVKNNMSLLDVFEGKALARDIVHIDDHTNMQFISARYGVPNPNDLLGGKQMLAFLNEVTEIFDLVVLDTPPVMAASDAVVLSRLVDAVVFVVLWEATPRQMVVNAIKQLQRAEARFAGTVVNRVNLKRHRQFRFGDQADYYGHYQAYAPR